jgi:hypothetical protein
MVAQDAAINEIYFREPIASQIFAVIFAYKFSFSDCKRATICETISVCYTSG